jgi:hypothetical protein
LAAPKEHEIAGSSAGLLQIGIDCLTGCLGQLEPDCVAFWSRSGDRWLNPIEQVRRLSV